MADSRVDPPSASPRAKINHLACVAASASQQNAAYHEPEWRSLPTSPMPSFYKDYRKNDVRFVIHTSMSCPFAGRPRVTCYARLPLSMFTDSFGDWPGCLSRLGPCPQTTRRNFMAMVPVC